MPSPRELLPELYDKLRRLAAARLAQERPGHTLEATALVHEAWLRLADASVEWHDRNHFLRVAATVMGGDMIPADSPWYAVPSRSLPCSPPALPP
jgi:hypothetical protein